MYGKKLIQISFCLLVTLYTALFVFILNQKRCPTKSLPPTGEEKDYFSFPFTLSASTVLNTLGSRLSGDYKLHLEAEIQNITSRPVLNPHDFGYIHNAPARCQGRNVSLLIGVPCKPDSFLARDTIRETWGQYAADPADGKVLLFFLGSTPNTMLQSLVDAEAKQHGDIVQETFLDTYQNLSLKSVAIVRWASIYCPDSSYLLKVDDDVYVNVPGLMRRLEVNFDEGKNPFFVMGNLRKNSPVFRNVNSKWYLSREEMATDVLPDFAGGPSYAMTTVTAMRLYVESVYTKMIYLEDVFLTGLCVKKSGSYIKLVNDNGFRMGAKTPMACPYNEFVMKHKVLLPQMKKMYEIFRILEKADEPCINSNNDNAPTSPTPTAVEPTTNIDVTIKDDPQREHKV